MHNLLRERWRRQTWAEPGASGGMNTRVGEKHLQKRKRQRELPLW